MIDVIKDWDEELNIYREVDLGYRFVDSIRKMDIVLEYENKVMGIEAKIQKSRGTAYQKLTYALEDAFNSPVPVIIVFSSENNAIKEDMKARLISSGIGLEVKLDKNGQITSRTENLLKQRIGIELGFNWLDEFEDSKVE
ncbi:MAG: PD-(D/E)XK nuclease superfamily protein [Nanoarchaeota archaeon]